MRLEHSWQGESGQEEEWERPFSLYSFPLLFFRQPDIVKWPLSFQDGAIFRGPKHKERAGEAVTRRRKGRYGNRRGRKTEKR